MRPVAGRVLVVALLTALPASPSFAFSGSHAVRTREGGIPSRASRDASALTLLKLSFEGNLDGEAGEGPTAADSIHYEAGRMGSGVYLGPENQLLYGTSENLDDTTGTVEFWIKPRWNGNDFQNHYAFRCGFGGGILIGKDAANYWRIILNRFNHPDELGIGLFVDDWLANQWHYAAFTWSASEVNVYVDGQLKATRVNTVTPPVIGQAEFQIGADGTASYLNAVIDELVISRGARTAQEIYDYYVAATTAVSVVMLNVEAEAHRVRIEWYAPDARIPRFTVYRRTSGTEWKVVGEPVADINHRIQFEDTNVAPGTQYSYRLGIVDSGPEEFSGEVWVQVPEEAGAPVALRLMAGHPNPFGAQVQLRYATTQPGRVHLLVHDVQGRHVATVVDEAQGPGWRSVGWDGRDDHGVPVPSGIYFARLESAGQVRTTKLVMAR